MRRAALWINLAGFAFDGVLMSVYGPILERVAARFGVSLATAGAIVGVHFMGALIGAFVFWRWRAAVGRRGMLAASYLALAIGTLTVLVAVDVAGFPLLCTGVLVAGLGFGGLDYGLSQMFASGDPARRTAMLNLLHGSFGIGTAAGPIVLGVAGTEMYPAVFAVGTVIALTGIWGAARGDMAIGNGADPPTAQVVMPVWLMGTFGVLYVLHVSVQGSIGAWEPTQLQDAGVSSADASLWVAGFWLATAASRFGLAWVGALPPARTVVLCCIATCVVAPLTLVPATAPLGYILCGFTIGPIFPVGLAWLGDVLPGRDEAIATVVIVSMIGGIAVPPLLGLLIGRVGPESLPVSIVVLALACASIAWTLWRGAPLRWTGVRMR